MSAEVSFDSGSIQMILIIGIIIVVGIYFYYENYKIKNQLLEFEYRLNNLNEINHLGVKNENNISYPTNAEEINISETNIPIRVARDEELNNELNNELNDELNDELNQIHQQMMSDNILQDTIPVQQGEMISDDIHDDNQCDRLDDDDKEMLNINLDDMLKDIILDNGTNNEIKEQDYSKMTVSQLKNILSEKNLPVSGNKTKLVQRILDNSK